MIWSLQILRFVAAAMVVYVHAAQTAFDATGSVGLVPYKITGLGLTGVDIFFVISGVVIAKTVNLPGGGSAGSSRSILSAAYLQ
jgi:exopolysaccharide production protein ExoZ